MPIELKTEPEPMTGRTVTLGLDYKVAAMLCYTPLLFIDIIAPIVWLKTEPKSNMHLRFHAIQGLGVAVVGFAFALITSVVFGVLGSIFGGAIGQLAVLASSLVSLALVGVCIYGMYCAYTEKTFRLPIIGEFAERSA